MRLCEFCGKQYIVVGKHYAHCKSRNGMPYDHLLAKKRGKHAVNLHKSLLRPCLTCGKQFKRLDVHRRHNVQCSDPSACKSAQIPTPPQQQPHSGSMGVVQHKVSDSTPQSTVPISNREPLVLPSPGDHEAWSNANELFD